jgi:hypothetical protein
MVEEMGHSRPPIVVKVKHPEVERAVRVQDFEHYGQPEIRIARRVQPALNMNPDHRQLIKFATTVLGATVFATVQVIGKLLLLVLNILVFLNCNQFAVAALLLRFTWAYFDEAPPHASFAGMILHAQG